MPRDSTVWTRATIALLAAVFAVSVYRAATLSITADEALAFDRCIRPPLRDVIPHFDPSNHVLNTLLVKRSVALFRLSEFSFRLPSVLFGGLLLFAVYRLGRRAVGPGPLLPATVACAVLNPLVMDHMALARGYGMALACLFLASDLMLGYLESPLGDTRRNLNLAGMCIGLSVSASVAFVFPCISLALTFLLVAASRGSLGFVSFVEQLAAPATTTAFILLIIPFSSAHLAQFTYGASTLSGSLPALLASALPAGAAIWYVIRREKGSAQALVILIGGTLLLTAAALVSAHRLWAIPYPMNRTGLYLAPLACLGSFGLASLLPGRIFRFAALAVAALVVILYIGEFRMGVYREWPQDSGVKSVVRILRREAFGRQVRIAASADLDPVVSFYRARYRLSNWEPIRHQPVNGAFDYYVLDAHDAGIVEERHLQVLYQDPGLILAR